MDLWATDEVHFQQHGSRCQMWVPPETKDPVLAASSDPAQRGILRCSPDTGWRDSVFQGRRVNFNAMTFLDFMNAGCGGSAFEPAAA